MVIITGASSGIGRALALRLGAAGYRVGLIARRREPLEAAAAAIAAAGGTAVAAVADVGDRAALRAAVAEVEHRLGPPDVLVANAGFGAPTVLDPLNIADVEATFRVNVLGVVYSIEAVLPGMLTRRTRAPARGLQPGRLQGTARRVGVLCQQGGRERVHGGPADRAAAPGRRGDDRLPGLRRHGDDADGLGHAVPDVGRRGGPAHRPADRPAHAAGWFASRCRWPCSPT